MTKMAARRKFLFDYEQVVAFCKDFKASDDSRLSTLQMEGAELERRYAKLINTYEEIMISDKSTEDADFLKEATTKYKDAYKKYIGCKSKISDVVTAKQKPRADESIRHDTTMGQQSFSSSLKLPPCDTPPFEGGYAKWPAFRDIFWAVFGTHPELSAAQKLYHLRSKTRGEAHQIVSKFDLVDDNFQLAWEALKNRYENPRILVHQQMKQLFGIQVAQTETAKSIRHIQRGINDSLAIFKSYKIKTEDWDPILVHHCSTKLPEETLRAWEDSLSNHKDLPTWSQMTEFLSKRVEVLETLADLRKPTTRESQGTKTQSFHSELNQKKSNMCKRCEADHPLRLCKYFNALSANERIKYAFANKYCTNCLSPNHFKKKCTSQNFCRKCGGKHHSMLHLDKGDKNNRVDANEPVDDDEQPTSSRRQTNTNSQPGRNNNSRERVQSHFSRNSGTTVLPTALVHVEQAGDLFTIRALLDGGSEKSFVSKRIQQMLALPIINHHSQISGLGGTIVGNSKGKCFVNIRSKKSEFKIKIEAIVVSKLAHFLPSKRGTFNDKSCRSRILQTISYRHDYWK